jgi:electron transfer flavoprotein alpha subunit
VQLPAAGETRTQVTGREQAVAEGLQLQDASVVVSGGRGLGAPEGFQDVEQLAETIGKDKAAVGASRAAVDLGWYPPSQQVGLTGKVVTPDLYIAVAISGASQHMAGCSGAKTIVAVNRDKDANIFGFAKYGIVGDFKQVLPALIEEIKKAKG